MQSEIRVGSYVRDIHDPLERKLMVMNVYTYTYEVYCIKRITKFNLSKARVKKIPLPWETNE